MDISQKTSTWPARTRALAGKAAAVAICLACATALTALAENAPFKRSSLVENVGGREIACELAVGDSAFLRVVAAPDIDGDGPGASSLVDPAVTAEKAGLAVAVNANAFRKPDRNDRVWSKGGPAIPYGEVVSSGVYLEGCEQKRLMFWVDSTNVCHIGRNPDFATVREGVSDWGGYFLRNGETDPMADAKPYPRSIVAHDASRRKVFLLVGEMSFVEAAEFLRRHGATDAMNLDGGGSAIMVPPARKGYRRPVPVLIGFHFNKGGEQ